jgi:hypothetical protein
MQSDNLDINVAAAYSVTISSTATLASVNSLAHISLFSGLLAILLAKFRIFRI